MYVIKEVKHPQLWAIGYGLRKTMGVDASTSPHIQIAKQSKCEMWLFVVHKVSELCDGK